MKEKKLYNSAIIPDELYVQRDADRKLKQIIQRMSKPAYISVARQMGKTNLLIQAKRTLENETNKYIYIDITNKFETAQECFRYIINQIINSNEQIFEFQEAKVRIEAARQTSKNNATEEYQNEIREILKYFKGNLIIFLDEVDDLRKHHFSDDIFGQIRKTYFINETYPSLKRITYVLSGVIDPEKLIKTKENSPFNIAIPIYLEDFSLPEFYELVSKSGLILENTIIEYLHDWLKGNPRMSFEILSLVEDQYIENVEITRKVIDDIINEFYLTNFKNPPIDHIRDLIKHNTEVRKALIKLKQGRLTELTDEVINKFYLFGITASKTKKDNLSIKNRVIEQSLSDDWLEKIELEKRGYYDFGTEKISQGLYLEGIQLLKEYLQNEPSGNFVSLAKHEIGKAYYELGNHEISNQYLTEIPIVKEVSTELYYWQLFYIGANYLKLGDFNEAMNYFEEIISESTIPQVVINALINKGELLINTPIAYDFQLIEGVYLRSIEYINKNFEKINGTKELFALIYYKLGGLYLKVKDKSHEAKRFFAVGLRYSNVETFPIFYLLIDSCIGDEIEERKKLYCELVERIIETNIAFLKNDSSIIPVFDESQLLLILSNLEDFSLIIEFNRLLNYSINNLYSLGEYELIYKVSVFSINNNNLKVGEILQKKILEYENVDKKILKHCYQFLGIIEYGKKNILKSHEYLLKYVDIFKEFENFNDDLQAIDFTSFNTLIDFYRKKRDFGKSLEIAKLIEKHFTDNMKHENKANSIFVLFFIMDYYAFIGDKITLSNYAKKILSLIDEVKPVLNDLSYADKKGLDDVETQTKSLLKNIKQIKTIEPINIEREPGRNEFVKVKYKNGRQIVVKYKKIIEDLRNGECILIS